MQQFVSRSEKDTEAFGKEMALSTNKGDFIALYGEMGSGKTVFMRGFVSALIPEARVSSPTYAILNVYEGEAVQINHFDMYRIESEDDLLSTGYEEVLSQGITVCEWPENIEPFLPQEHIKIRFQKTGENERLLKIERGSYDGIGN